MEEGLQYPRDIFETLDSIAQFAKEIVVSSSGLIARVRKELVDKGLINKLDLDRDTERSIEGIDSAYSIHRTLSTQYMVLVAVGYSKKTPPRILVNVIPSLLSDYSDSIIGGLARLYELALAYSSKSDIVILDGSFISFLTDISDFLYRLSNDTNKAVQATKKFLERGSIDPKNVYNVAGSEDFTTKVLERGNVVALPKASGSQDATRFVVDTLNIDNDILDKFTDRSLFTITLREGEYFVYHTSLREDLNIPSIRHPLLFNMTEFLGNRGNFSDRGGLTIAIYRPYSWTPAFKVEIPGKVSRDKVEEVLVALSKSIKFASIKEHFEQYMADAIASRLVVRIHNMVSTIVQRAISEIDHDIASLLYVDYRT